DFRNVGESGFDNFFSRRQLGMTPLLTFGFDPGIVANEPTDDPSPTLIDAANALFGLAIEDSESQFFNKAAARQPSDNKFFKQHEYDFFAQDSWKLRRNLTLNMGLRYQYNGIPYETSGNLSNLLRDPGSFALGEPVTFSIVGPGSGHNLYEPD